MLRIFFTSSRNAWRVAGKLARNEAAPALSSLGWLRSRPGTCDGSLRVILRDKEFYGSNRVDRRYTLRHWVGGVGMVDRQANTATSRPGCIVIDCDTVRSH